MNKTTELKNWEKYCEEVRGINNVRKEIVEQKNRLAKDSADYENKWSLEKLERAKWRHFFWLEKQPKKYKFLNMGLRDEWVKWLKGEPQIPTHHEVVFKPEKADLITPTMEGFMNWQVEQQKKSNKSK